MATLHSGRAFWGSRGLFPAHCRVWIRQLELGAPVSEIQELTDGIRAFLAYHGGHRTFLATQCLYQTLLGYTRNVAVKS